MKEASDRSEVERDICFEISRREGPAFAEHQRLVEGLGGRG